MGLEPEHRGSGDGDNDDNGDEYKEGGVSSGVE